MTTNLTCNGFPNGTAKVVPSGGVNPYDYYWQQLEALKDRISGLDSGIFYIVQITDGNNCILYDSMKVGSPMAFQFIDTSSHPWTIQHTMQWILMMDSFQ